MITDFKILGIDETSDPEIIKSAYKKRVKELHPDTSDDKDSVKNHLLFVEVCKAYKRLMGNARPGPKKHAAQEIKSSSGGLGLHKDPAYVYYKQGMNYLSKIHPSSWNLDTNRRLNTKISETDQLELQNRVRGIISLFPKAYLYFSLVVNDFPDSPWAADAGAKMNLIEERTKRYRQILESFDSWNAKD